MDLEPLAPCFEGAQSLKRHQTISVLRSGRHQGTVEHIKIMKKETKEIVITTQLHKEPRGTLEHSKAQDRIVVLTVLIGYFACIFDHAMRKNEGETPYRLDLSLPFSLSSILFF